MDSIIQMFYQEMDSELSKRVISSAEYQDIRDETCIRWEEIKRELSSNAAKSLFRLDELQGKMLTLESETAFSCGFRCGIRLMWKLGMENLLLDKEDTK